MKESVLLVFAGTTEGRALCEKLIAAKRHPLVSVATEYGEALLPPQGAEVFCGRMNQEQIFAFLQEHQVTMVVDATHPYAVLATEHIQAACQQAGVQYLRLLREETTPDNSFSSVSYVHSTEEAIHFLQQTEGLIFLTTGAKEVNVFAEGLGAQRLITRVLPAVESLQKCLAAGVPVSQILCMQGPFSAETNATILRQYHASFLVTKDSGKAGGFFEKIQAAEQVGIPAVIIGRPKQVEGFSFKEVCRMLKL